MFEDFQYSTPFPKSEQLQVTSLVFPSAGMSLQRNDLSAVSGLKPHVEEPP